MNLAACRSATLRSKIVMRFGCCLVAVSLAMSCFATPRAKAVVSETALLGSIFGSLLVSLGYSWAAENMDVPTFGESIYKLIQEHDEANKDTGVQLLRDLNIAGLTSTGTGKISFPYQWVQAARSFSEWFISNYFSGSNTAVISNPSAASIIFTTFDDTLVMNYPESMTFDYTRAFSETTGVAPQIPITSPTTLIFSQNSVYESDDIYAVLYRMKVYVPGTGYKMLSNGNNFVRAELKGDFKAPFSVSVNVTQDDVDAGAYLELGICGSCSFIPRDAGTISFSSATVLSSSVPLTAEKPAEVHYPDVAEDGSEVYEVTYQGVTATDIEGIIQGAVDQILAGTASIAGEVTQAQDVPADPEVPPELDGLDLPALGAALTSRFPFSIPWDVARGISLLAAPAEAPYWEVDFLAPISYRVGGWEGSTTVVLDFSEFEILGQLSRWMSTIGFCLMLAASTKRLIWVA